MTVDWKKKLLPNLQYLLFVYLFDKLCQAVRLAPGLDASEKFLHLSQGFTEAFSSGLPSLHPLDLLCRAQSSSATAMIAFAPPMHTVYNSPPCYNRWCFFHCCRHHWHHQPTDATSPCRHKVQSKRLIDDSLVFDVTSLLLLESKVM